MDEPETDWRDDPGWQLTWYRSDLYSAEEAPATPTAEAELSHPATWATLYVEERPAAVWARPSATRSTIGA